MNRRAIVLGTTATAVAAFLGAAAFYHKPKKRVAAAAPDVGSALVRPHAPVSGPSDAPVTIVEFMDPSCEACRAFYPWVKRILSDYPNDVKLVIRYAPLHNGSDEAVRILEAARLQNRFEEVLQALFRDQQVWATHDGPNMDKAWEIAGGAGVDVAKAKKDAVSPAIANVLAQDVADMRAINLTGTPTFFVNGKPLADFGTQQLIDMVAREVAATRKSATGS